MKFEKVSLEQYLNDCLEDTLYYKDSSIKLSQLLSGEVTISSFDRDSVSLIDTYEDIKLPQRATQKSAGYDFYAPYEFSLSPGQTMKIATGIRVILDDDKFLMCAPRSGHGFKARIQLDNTIGVIDADYSDSKNEGHIMLKITNDSRTQKCITVKKGEGMVQAIILKYFTVDDDNTSTQRDGGFGSTTKEDTK